MGDRTYRASKHYVWRMTDTLGQGSFGSVFRGIHKVTGCPVAVKVFNRNYGTVNQKIREFEILQSLGHPNVVKLLAIEEELSSMSRSVTDKVSSPSVMIMELCEAGSLYCTLDKPENSFGLSETEFLLVLDHLTAGVKYLRQNDIIHRDYKPSNILKSFDPDGNVVYKLCDFGAARVLRDGEQHMSIVGTEEYLLPDIHERVFCNGSRKSFPSTSDLWSLGATLYQLATGQLPFRPFNGRSNKEKMQTIVSKKPAGAICGVEIGDGGKVVYSSQLPKECRFSSGLRPLVENLLAGLLKNTAEVGWTFDEYFQVVADILSRRKLQIFSFADATNISVYLPVSSTVDELSKEIELQTKVPPVEQILITFDGRLITDTLPTAIATDRQSDSGIPDLCLFEQHCRRDNSVDKVYNQRKIPHSPIFNSVTSIEYDCELAKQCAMLTCWIHRELERVTMADKCLQLGIVALKVLVEQKQTDCQAKYETGKSWWSLLQRNLLLLRNCGALQISTNQEKLETLTEVIKTIGKKEDSGSEICKLMGQMEADLTGLKKIWFTGDQQHNLAMEENKPSAPRNELEFMKQQISATTEIWNVFKRDKAMQIQNDEVKYFNELQWHRLLKEQLVAKWKAIEPRFNGARLNDLLNTRALLSKCHESFLSCLNLEIRLEEKTEMLQEMLAAFDSSLGQTVDNFQQCVAAVVVAKPQLPEETVVKTAESVNGEVQLPSRSISKTSTLSNVQLANGLLDVMQMAKELRELIDQNVQLSERLQSMSF